MAGMDRDTGGPIEGLKHIKQSIGDILGTPIGTRLGRREYGSLLPDLIDKPMTPANILRVYAATALAITRWENRVRLRRVSLVMGENSGSARLTIEADRVDKAGANALVRLSLPLSA